jgi:hypothetical protein
MTRLQNVMFQELRSGIHIVQTRDNQIVEGRDLFNGMRQELDALSKQISDNTLQNLVLKVSVHNGQNGISIFSKRMHEVNTAMKSITTSRKNIPSIRELRLHAQTMEVQLQQVAEVNMELTSTMKGYKFRESSPFHFSWSSMVAGVSGAQGVNPQ